MSSETLYYIYQPVGNDFINVTEEEGAELIILGMLVNHEATLEINSYADIYAKTEQEREDYRSCTLSCEIDDSFIHFETSTYKELKKEVWAEIEAKSEGGYSIRTMKDWLATYHEGDEDHKDDPDALLIRQTHFDKMNKQHERVIAGQSEASIKLFAAP